MSTSKRQLTLFKHGWYMQSNKAHDIMIMTRTNFAQHHVEHLAGSTCEPEVHQFLPLSYWVVEIRYGNCPTAAAIRKTGSNLQGPVQRKLHGGYCPSLRNAGVQNLCIPHVRKGRQQKGQLSCTRR